MKCIKQDDKIQRVTDETAARCVKSGKWVYVPKSEWKALGNKRVSIVPEAPMVVKKPKVKKNRKTEEVPVIEETPVVAPTPALLISTAEKILKAKKAKKVNTEAPKASRKNVSVNDFGALDIPNLKN